MSKEWKPTRAAQDGHRTWEYRPKRRSRCMCCGEVGQYVGKADGVVLMGGCKWRVRKWVQDPTSTPPAQ